MRAEESFYRLTPDTMLAAVEALGLEPDGRLLLLNSLENRVASIALADGRQVVAKFYRPGRWSRETILEEHAFLQRLAATEIPVCVPMAFSGETLFSDGDMFYAIWPRTGGRQLEEPDADTMRQLGRLLGRMHASAAGHAFHSRLRLDSETYVERSLAVTAPLVPSGLRAAYTGTARRIAELYDRMSAGVPVQAIHGDCHPGNILADRGQFFFLDFDDCLTGPVVQDLWMLLPDKGAAAAGLRAAFLEGYTLFAPFDPSWFSLIEPLRALRYVHYAAWIARRRDDPSFKNAFPDFGGEAYWEQETSDLVEQLALIESESGAGPASSGEPELTNKDFFWDL